jgi:DGQHR domain-containing protein
MTPVATLNITTPVPSIQGHFGRRLVTYTTQIPALQIKKILGHDPRSKNWKLLPEETRKIYQQIQRPTAKNRRDAVSTYIEQRLGPRDAIGAFPSISIGVTNPLKFVPSEPGSAIGILHIDEDGQRILLDGLGRLTGALDLADEGSEGKALVEKIVFPVTFYLPSAEQIELSAADLGQLFSDFNFRVYPVPARINLSLDQSDIYISLANALSKEPFIALHGGMEYKAASLGKKSSALVVQQVLFRTVRGACEGRDFQENNLASIPGLSNLTDSTFDKELSSVADYFSEIATRMGDRWAARESLHLTSAGWQALGVFHHDLFHRGLSLSPAELDKIYDAVAGVDWSRSNRDWADVAKLGIWAKPKDSEMEQLVILGAGRNNTQAILDYLRKVSGIDEKLQPPIVEETTSSVEPESALASAV